MRALVNVGVICVGLAYTGVALGAPKVDVRAQYKIAAQLDASGEYDKALVSIESGLAIAPRDVPLLGLKGAVLLKLRDYPGALTAYQAYLDAGATGADRREAQKIVERLRTVRSTFLDISIANGPAPIYLDSRTLGVFCTAAPSCRKAVLPGAYKVIAERPGFERWTDNITIDNNQTATLAITLVEKRSPLTVRVEPAGARVAIDGAPWDASTAIAAGTHRITVSQTGYAEARREVTAREGKPVELSVALVPLVPIRVEPPGATLMLDDKPPALEDGNIAIPPGSHVLVARAEGFREHRIEIPAARAAGYQLAIVLVRESMSAEAVEAQNARTRKRVGLVVAAGGAVALGVGAVFAVKARSTHQQAVALCGDDLVCDSQEDFDRGHSLVLDSRSKATTAGLLLAGGGALAVTGAVLWLTASGERRAQTAQIVPVIDEDRIGVTVAGRF